MELELSNSLITLGTFLMYNKSKPINKSFTDFFHFKGNGYDTYIKPTGIKHNYTTMFELEYSIKCVISNFDNRPKCEVFINSTQIILKDEKFEIKKFIPNEYLMTCLHLIGFESKANKLNGWNLSKDSELPKDTEIFALLGNKLKPCVVIPKMKKEKEGYKLCYDYSDKSLTDCNINTLKFWKYIDKPNMESSPEELIEKVKKIKSLSDSERNFIISSIKDCQHY